MRRTSAVSTTVEFRTSIPKTVGLVSLGIVMIAVSYFAATQASGYKMMLSWFGVPFFALAVVGQLYPALSPRTFS